MKLDHAADFVTLASAGMAAIQRGQCARRIPWCAGRLLLAAQSAGDWPLHGSEPGGVVERAMAQHRGLHRALSAAADDLFRRRCSNAGAGVSQ